MSGDVLRSGWRRATQPLTSTHFGPTIFLDFPKKVVVSYRVNEPIYLAYGTLFRVRLEKGNTGGRSMLQGKEKTLVMTESAAISAVAQKECLKEPGAEKYEILAALDGKTSDICREMDGKVFDIKDYEIGVTAPPFHPNCKSTIVPCFGDGVSAAEEWEEEDERGSGDGSFIAFADIMDADEAIRYQEYWGRKYSETAPISIPSKATMKIQSKTGYDQIQFKWSDGTYKYDARWHTRTPGASAEQGNTWVIGRTTPGNANGQRSVSHILTGKNIWTPRNEWQDAIAAWQNGTATDIQNRLLEDGHWLAS